MAIKRTLQRPALSPLTGIAPTHSVGVLGGDASWLAPLSFLIPCIRKPPLGATSMLLEPARQEGLAESLFSWLQK